MKKIIATFWNECRLFIRDITGMVLLFLMPLGLTIIMALIQDAPFREYQHIRFEILWLDADKGQLAENLREGLEETGQFRLIDSLDGRPLDTVAVKAAIQGGRYKIGIIVPRSISAEVVNSANQVANELGKSLGAAGKLPERPTRQATVEIYFDPVTKQAMKSALLNALDKQLTKVQAEMILGRLSRKMEDLDSTGVSQFNLEEKLQAVRLREFAAGSRKGPQLSSNSVQHNVPAWAIFGLFFIIVPISGNMIREREEGSLMRIRMVPGSYLSILAGKLLFYVLLGTAQFYMMLVAGLLILPHLGLPALVMGQAPAALLVTALAIAITATAYGLLVGAVFQTPNQALPFGAISIVILSAIGGIWVPVEILPPGLQQLAKASPMYWALDAINDLFLRHGNLKTVATHMGILSIFSACFLFIAGWIENYRKK
ncbi:ABC transporter permease [Flavihumibacter petaseus]|uniref:Putative ABC transporter permease protein n=1 Tax=Flavihumibacter petaseus NBRC 106054 TaxID=1220578 RepID=A0A0E9MUK9_9BACT|nr:ABC transporter permease [Flavihumibacter petaseus]GAO41173.1 putative ABC transporter permease protein [Flavihumibacter petaseus NBRC 106054]